MPVVSLGLAQSVELSGDKADLRLVAPGWQLALGGFPERTLCAIRQLATGQSTESEIHQGLALGGPGSSGSSTHWYNALGELLERRAVRCELKEDEAPLLRWIPPKQLPVSNLPTLERDSPIILSKYACVRRRGRQVVIESPLTTSPVELCDPRVLTLVGSLAMPITPERVEALGLGLTHEASGAVLSVLANARMLGDPAEEGQGAFQYDGWSFPDLLFHGGSNREGPRAIYQPPANSPWAGTFHPREGPPDLALPDPVATDLGRDMTLDEVMDRRHSIRHYDDASPITLAALAEFLWRTLRVKSVIPGDGEAVYEHSRRPYPSGGALNPLEVYPVVRSCLGLDEGVYQYDPRHHGLARRKELDNRAGQALRLASAAMGGGPTPQVLLVIAARPARVFWKYRSIGYAVILREVGVVMQTMYLVATSMGLAPCAVGVGDGVLLPAADEPTFDANEVSVGAFCLGSPLT